VLARRVGPAVPGVLRPVRAAVATPGWPRQVRPLLREVRSRTAWSGGVHRLVTPTIAVCQLCRTRFVTVVINIRDCGLEGRWT
jgi:hypothetical protein